MTTENIMELLAYLERDCNGEDRFAFWTENNEPDIQKARLFAEDMRQRLGGFLHSFVEVEQRVNVVFLTITGDVMETV